MHDRRSYLSIIGLTAVGGCLRLEGEDASDGANQATTSESPADETNSVEEETVEEIGDSQSSDDESSGFDQEFEIQSTEIQPDWGPDSRFTEGELYTCKSINDGETTTWEVIAADEETLTIEIKSQEADGEIIKQDTFQIDNGQRIEEVIDDASHIPGISILTKAHFPIRFTSVADLSQGDVLVEDSTFYDDPLEVPWDEVRIVTIGETTVRDVPCAEVLYRYKPSAYGTEIRALVAEGFPFAHSYQEVGGRTTEIELVDWNRPA